METAPKRVIGRPFRKGQSGNPGGRPKAIFTAALMSQLGPEDAEAVVRVVKQQALAGEAWAIQMLWDRLEGKAIGRNESGQPGEFTGLEDKPLAELIELAQRRA